MAFNQVEVMVKNLQGQELNLSSGKSTLVAPAKPDTAVRAEAEQDPITPTTPVVDPQ
ncbi:hypothetical protein D3C80_1877090 [compost metagenome]